MKNALDSFPNIAAKKWQELGPISAEEILNNSDKNRLDIQPDEIEFKYINNRDISYIGFVKKGTEERHGVGRLISKISGNIFEGFWKDGFLNGFGR